MLAKDVRNGKKSCLSKAADDEPVFILRAHDALAPDVVDAWADLVAGLLVVDGAVRLDDATHAQIEAKIAGAHALAHQMRAWQALNGAKIPD